VVRARADADAPGIAAGADAVTNGILDERLQDEVRNWHVQDRLLDVDVDLEPVAEPRLLDVEVAPDELELATERHERAIAGGEGLAQEVAEPGDHLVGRLGILVHQLGNGVERVEEKVRVELHLQELETRRRQPCLEKRRSHLALLARVVVSESVREGDDRPVEEEVRRQAGNQDIGIEPEEQPAQLAIDDQLDEADGKARRHVHGETPTDRRPSERKPPRQDHHAGREDSPDVHLGERHSDRQRPPGWIPDGQVGERRGHPEEEGQGSPASEDPDPRDRTALHALVFRQNACGQRPYAITSRNTDITRICGRRRVSSCIA
jgi:hypothetical protein